MEPRPPSPILHVLALRVYYEDTDFSGFVYHASYLRFMERARTEWLRALGIDQRSAFAASPPLSFVVRHMEIDYRRPARMDDEIRVETSLLQTRGASLVLRQSVLREAELLVEAQVTVASLSGGRPTRLPKPVSTIMAAFRNGERLLPGDES
jgi:acyl-CoA thioester hydrolase